MCILFLWRPKGEQFPHQGFFQEDCHIVPINPKLLFHTLYPTVASSILCKTHFKYHPAQVIPL